MDADTLTFFINGRKVEVSDPSPTVSLLQFLRRTLLLTGTKEACGQGSCGACTVMLSKYNRQTNKITHVSINACLIPICYLHGMAITTVEGVGSTRNGLHPIQKQLVASHGMQCGFCTPGMVMTMYTLTRNNPHPSQELIERVLEGNLCRCTGYRPIVDAFQKCPCDSGSCCKSTSDDVAQKQCNVVNREVTQGGETQDPIFPPELQLNQDYYSKTVTLKGNGYTWIRPSSLSEFRDLRQKYQNSHVMMGCTSLSYSLKKNLLDSKVLISCTNIAELGEIKTTDTGIIVGSAVTITELEGKIQSLISAVGAEKQNGFTALLECIRWLGVDQIRNIATVGGHVMSSAPNFDLQVYLMAVNAELCFMTKDSSEFRCKFDNVFLENWKQYEDLILVSINVPFLKENEYIKFKKQPSRRGFDFAIINSAMFVKIKKSTSIIEDLRIVFGGVGPRPMLLDTTTVTTGEIEWNEGYLCKMTDSIVQQMGCKDMKDIKYKSAVACGFCLKFFVEVQKQLQGDSSHSDLDLQFTTSKGSQIYDTINKGVNFAVYKPLPHYAGDSMAAGEALYIDDLPAYQNEVFIAYVTSTKAHAKILSVDTTEAMKSPGVVDYINYKDVPGHNNFGMWTSDSQIFAVDKVTCHGQVIGAIAATTREKAREAATLVRIEYEELDPIFSNKEAIEKGSFYDFTNEIKQGNTEKGLRTAQHILKGEIEIGSQEHMYMETQAVLAIPRREQNEMEVIAGTQHCSESQIEVGKFLGIPANRVVVKCKRIGGAFGGKTTETVYHIGASVVTAWKLNRPVRCYLDRETDMKITGKRHPVMAKYQVGFNDDGKITTVDIDFYVNAGHFNDNSPSIILLSLIHISGSYNFENFRAKGFLCKTNIPSSTAIRGFGGPQSVFIIENIVNDVAVYLKKDKAQICEINMYKEGDTTPTHKHLTKFTLPRCWKECKEDSNYNHRRENVIEINRNSRYKKRGISMMPLMFPIGYAPKFLNQAGALLNVYLDGSVLLTHCGVEMGQGINTKMIQVAGTALDIPTDNIYISEISTSTVPNATETGGSAGNDINAGAVLNACEVLMERLAPFKKDNPQGTWKDWVNAAYLDRVSLSVAGFYKTPGNIGYNFDTHTGVPCPYMTYGVACVEVEVDCLTGEHQILRADIVMDVGKSLNPAIDVGQVEGGFMMGCGLVTMERLAVDSSTGQIWNTGPINYKVPTVRNIPREFNVKLLKECNSGTAVYSSKGTGEPPLLLAISVHQALKNAIMSARLDNGLVGNIRLDSPLTVDKIRLACEDEILKKCCNLKGKDTSKQQTL